jgi:hypothetical protein
MSSWTWYRLSLAWTDVSEKVLSPSSEFLKFDKNLLHLRNPEDGDSTFSETSVQASATRYQVQEYVFKVQSLLIFLKKFTNLVFPFLF